MADFDSAVSFVLDHEKGYVNNPNDPGGETNFGISKRSYPGIDIRSLTVEGARAIYLRDWWKYAGVNSQAIANKLLDIAVNCGSVAAARMLQESLSYLLAGPIVVDGIVGPHTVDLVNAADEAKVLKELKARAAYYHTQVAIVRPSERGDLLGWLRRDIDG